MNTITFVITVLILAVILSPALMSIVGVGSAFGFKSGLPLTDGALLEANIVITLLIGGFTPILATIPNLKINLSMVFPA